MSEWSAKWIWDASGPTPHNYYLQARKSFALAAEPKSATLRCSADARYFLFVNGRRIGNGPARCWYFNQEVDTYDLVGELGPGENVIAFLVLQPGESNFQYQLARGGLLAQVEVDGQVIAATDGTWKTLPSPAYDRGSARVCCQQAFCEEYDARKAAHGWTDAGFDDGDWQSALVVGPVGCQPWGQLKERTIAFLTDEPRYPARFVSARRVRKLPYHFSFDTRPTLLDGATDSNSRNFRSAVATVVTAPRDCECTLHVFDVPHVAKVEVNGADAGRPGEQGGLKLKAGENLLVIDTSTLYHHFWVAITLDGPEGLSFRTPGGGAHFAIIGPYECPVGEMPIWGHASEAELLAAGPKMQEVLPEHEGSVQPEQSIRTAEGLDGPVSVTNPQACCWANRDATVIEPAPEGQAVELLLDFGRELVGFIEFEVEASGGTMLEWDFFESIQDGRRQPVEGNTIRYVCKEGAQAYVGIVRHGFRYAALHISGATRHLSLRRVLCHLNTYPVAQRGSFECSDDRLNRIYDICAWTTRLCTEDTFVDCPAFEQTFWVGDARNEALVSYTCFGGYDITRRCLELVPQSMFRSPIPEGQTPSGWQSVLTAWALFWGWACAEYYEFTGEMDFVEGIYPELKRMSEACLGMLDDEGLLTIEAWNMLDWAPMDTPGRGVVTHQNCELVATLRTAADLGAMLGQSEDAARWRRAADALAGAINARLWDEEKEAYVDCLKDDGSLSPVVSQQTNTMAYLCDVVPEERLERIVAIVREAPEGFVRIGSPFMMFFSMEALARLGDYQRIVDWSRQWWGMMLDAGATSCWETFPGHNPVWYTRSHCHAWSAAPGFFLPTVVLGVTPMQPGFRKVRIAPQPCDLSWARGRVPTPHGEIEVSWKREEGELVVEVALPPGVAAEVAFADRKEELPAGALACVALEDGGHR